MQFITSAFTGVLSFLSIVPKSVYFLPALVIVWSILIGGTVSDLNIAIPFTETGFDLQTPTVFIADVIATLVSAMPWMDVILDVFLFAIQFKIMIMIVGIIKFVVSIFVQS